MLTIPSKILIGPYEITVEPLPEEIAEHTAGDYHKRRIRLAVDKPEAPIYTADTLLHEMLHAIQHLYCVEQEEEEQLTTILATTLIATLLHNPELRRFFTEVFQNPHFKVLHKIV